MSYKTTDRGGETMRETEKRREPGATYERDKEDLARFRAALAKLNACQKREVIQRMLETPDTP